jgi:hypothetical protein
VSNLAKRSDKSLSEMLGDATGVRKALAHSTAPLKLQRRRTEIEGCRIRVESLLSRFKNRRLTPKQRQELYLECQLMSSFGILKGISLLTDMLSYQDEALIKDKKTGVKRRGIRRVAYMEYMWDRLTEIKDALDIKFSPEDKARLAEGMEEGEQVPESLGLINAIVGLDQKISHMYDMLHEIGLHHNPKIFEVKDGNDVVISEDRFTDPPEFFEGEDTDATGQPEEVGDEDEEVLSDDEAEEIRKKAEQEDTEDEGLPEEEGEEEGEDDES